MYSTYRSWLKLGALFPGNSFSSFGRAAFNKLQLANNA